MPRKGHRQPWRVEYRYPETARRPAYRSVIVCGYKGLAVIRAKEVLRAGGSIRLVYLRPDGSRREGPMLTPEWFRSAYPHEFEEE